MAGSTYAGLALGRQPDPLGGMFGASVAEQMMAHQRLVQSLTKPAYPGARVRDVAPSPGDPRLMASGMNVAGNFDFTSPMAGLGIGGILAGKGARTADLAALDLAHRMTRAQPPIDPKRIWAETGWFKGPDKQWRFEIDDSTARMREDPNAINARVLSSTPDKYGDYLQTPVELNAVMTHPELERAYFPPNLITNPDIHFAPLGGRIKGMALPGGLGTPDKIALDWNLLTKGEPNERSTMLHELQHLVQEREGFQGGGNERVAQDVAYRRANEQLSELAKRIGREQDPEGRKFLQDRYDTLLLQKLELTPYESYRRLAGEAEARAVQARMTMGPLERRMTIPTMSYDVPLRDLLLKPKGSP